MDEASEKSLRDNADLALILRTGLCEEKDTAMNEKSPFGRRYDREFKDHAVALVRGGKRITAVARDLGVSPWALGRSRADCQRRPSAA